MNVNAVNSALDNTYGFSSLVPDVGVTGFASTPAAMRRRKLGGPHVNRMATAKSQVARVMAISTDLEAIPMIIGFFVQRLVVPTINNAPIKMRATLNTFLVEVLQNIIVLGYAAIAFDSKTGMPIVVSAEQYTPMTREEYTTMYADEMEPPVAWREKQLCETHHAVFDCLLQQNKYWHPKIGAPIMVTSNYSPLINGYPSSPLASLTRITDFGRIMHQSNTAAAIKSVSTEVHLVSGAVFSPKMLMQNGALTVAAVINQRNRTRQTLIEEQIRKDVADDIEMAGELMNTRVRMAHETQLAQFRPAALLGVARRDLAIYAIEAVLRAYGFDPTSLHMPATAMRSAHINLKDAEDRQNVVLQMREVLLYALEIWKICARHMDTLIPAEDVDSIDMPVPIAGDVVSLLMDRLKPDALARLLAAMIPVTADDFISIDATAEPAAKMPRKT